MRNDSFVVEDTAGRRYVLRRYRRNPDQWRIEFQLRFQQELHLLGYPTSEIVPSAADELLVVNEAGPWVLFTYIEGSEYDFARMGQVAEAGRRLAQFHTITESIDLEEVVIDINPSAQLWWTRGEEQIAALEQASSAASAPGVRSGSQMPVGHERVRTRAMRTSVNNGRAMRVAFLVGMGVALLLVVHGLLNVAGGGSGWDSATERTIYGLLQILAGSAMTAGLLLSSRTPRIELTLVAAGVVGISILWYWFLIVTIPVGLGLIAIAYSRGRVTV